jgi:hypothetical protein
MSVLCWTKEQQEGLAFRTLLELPEDQRWWDDIDKRWTRIGELVEQYGSMADKIAWMLCRGDAGEWRYNAKD